MKPLNTSHLCPMPVQYWPTRPMLRLWDGAVLNIKKSKFWILSFENIPFRQDSLLTWETNRALKSGSTIGLTDFACCPLRLVIVTPCSSKVFRHLRRETSEMPTWYCKIAREQQAVFPTSAATSTMMRVRLGKKLSPFAIAACIKNDYTNADNSSISLLHTHTSHILTICKHSETEWQSIKYFVYLQPSVIHEQCQLLLLVKAHLFERIVQLV